MDNHNHTLFVGLIFLVVTCLFSLKAGMKEHFWETRSDRQVTGIQSDLAGVRGNVNLLALVVAKNTKDLQSSATDYSAVTSQLRDISAQVERVRAPDLTDITASTATASAKVDSLSSQFQTLSSQVSGLSTTTAELSKRVAALPTQVAYVAAPVAVAPPPLAVDDTRITALETALVNIQNRSSAPQALLSVQNPAGDFLTVQPNSIMRKVGGALTIGQSTSINGDPTKSIVSSDITISGQPDLWHALAFGGTANDPIYSTVIAERKVSGGQSELLLAKFKDYDNGQGPDQIRHFAPRHVFATFPEDKSVLPSPTNAQSAFRTVDANNKVMMQIEPSGVTIGNHKLVSTGNVLNVCNTEGNNCKSIY